MIVNNHVELFTSTVDAERVIEHCGREAYGSADSKDMEGCRTWIKKRIENGEEDVLEHASATFYIVCSRVVSHELVRHRIGSYTQRSMRFSESATADIIVPNEIKEEDRTAFAEDMEDAQLTYVYWRDKYPRQTARYALPHATATSLYATYNFRTIRHIIDMRCALQAQPEMREIAKAIGEICLEKWPGVFGDKEGVINGN